MRVHANYEQLQLWRDAAALEQFARPENMIAARLEPVLRQSLAKTVADLVFRSDVGYLCIPAILIDSPQLIGREMDRFVWPQIVDGALDDDATAALESFLMPWIRSITLGKGLNREVIRHFGTDVDRQAFEAAREARYVGAADSATSANALSPYVYASRYAIGKSVAICGAPDGLQGAALLSSSARVAVTDLSAADKKIGLRWFPTLAQHDGSPDLVITGPQNPTQDAAAPRAVRIRLDAGAQNGERECVVAHAYPMDILFTYETLHGPSTRSFALHVQERALPARGDVPAPHHATGGSGGRVLIALRNDWERMPDSDVESALELVDLLRGEGLTVDVTGEPTTPDYASYDIVHCFNLIEVPSALGFLARAKQAGVRTVLTATFMDVANELTWGAQTGATCFRQDIDEASIARFLGFFGRRALLSPGWDERARRGPIPGYDALVAQALALCDVVIAESEREATVLREIFGRDGNLRIVPPFIPVCRAPSVEPPVTLDRFILLHAPLEARNNQIFAVRAAREAGLPIVLCGPARDMEYAARVREAAGNAAVFVGAATPQETDWLYAAADVVLDASWYTYGIARLWRAALSGARLCVSQTGAGGELAPDVAQVDPVTCAGIAEGIAAAKAVPPAERLRLAGAAAPDALLRNVLAAYLALDAPGVPA